MLIEEKYSPMRKWDWDRQSAYRLSSLVPGSLALYLADVFNWQVAHWSVSATLLVIMGFTLWMPEPKVQLKHVQKGFKDIFGKPFKEFLDRNGRKNVALILLFMLFYKLGDSMAVALASPFYLDLGFTKTDLASTVKFASLWSSIAGGIIGGIWMLKMGVQRSLWVFGWCQLITILGFAALAWDSSILPLQGQYPNLTGEQIAQQMGLSPNTLLLFIVISAEHLGVGLGTAAFVAFIAQHTNKRFSAAQFALLTSISGLPRTIASSQAGWIIELMGYTQFFLLCTVLALPGMGLLLFMSHIKPVTDNEQLTEDN